MNTFQKKSSDDHRNRQKECILYGKLSLKSIGQTDSQSNPQPGNSRQHSQPLKDSYDKSRRIADIPWDVFPFQEEISHQEQDSCNKKPDTRCQEIAAGQLRHILEKKTLYSCGNGCDYDQQKQFSIIVGNDLLIPSGVFLMPVMKISPYILISIVKTSAKFHQKFFYLSAQCCHYRCHCS